MGAGYSNTCLNITLITFNLYRMPTTLRKNCFLPILYSIQQFRFITLFLVLNLCYAFSIHAQMRQVYVDNVDANNEIKKISFYSPSRGSVAFTKWIGNT